MRSSSLTALLLVVACSSASEPTPTKRSFVSTPVARPLRVTDPAHAHAALDSLRASRLSRRLHPAESALSGDGVRLRLLSAPPSRILGAPEVSALLPRIGGDAARIGPSDDEGAWIEVAEADAPRVEPTAEGNLVAYSGADRDLLVLVEAQRVETLHVLRRPARHVTLTSKLSLGPAIGSVEVTESHGLRVIAHGAPVLEAPPPIAFDARGERRAMRVSLTRVGDAREYRLSLSLDTAGFVPPLVIDPAWTTVGSSMAQPRRNFAWFQPAGGPVLAIGGHGGSGIGGTPTAALASVEAFDPSTLTWSASPAMPAVHNGPFAVTASNGKIFVGNGDGTILTSGSIEVYRFEPSTRGWTTVPFPGQTTGAVGFTLSDGALVIGAGPTVACARYSSASDTWTNVTMSLRTVGHSYGQIADGRIVGLTAYGGTKYLMLFDPTTGWSSPTTPTTWGDDFVLITPNASLPGQHRAIGIGGTKVLVFGGRHSSGTVSDAAYVYDVATGVGAYGSPLLTPRAEPQVVRLPGGKILAIGGMTDALVPSDDVDIYDPATGKWQPAGHLATARMRFGAIALADGRVVVMGGHGLSGVLASTEIFSLQPLGAGCADAGECQSGICVDGVCCNGACTETCKRCNVVGSVGTCTAATGAPRTAGGCGAYATCTAGACSTSCSTDAACASTHYCASSACAPKKDRGVACTATRECASGYCVDGVCCDSACSGQCEACDVAGKVGTCWPATGKPHGARAACSTPTTDPDCGNRCNGLDRTKCVLPPATTACGAATCSDGIERHVSLCNGTGACSDAPKTCSPYACGTSACKSTCTTRADCAAGFGCKGSVCAPLEGLGAACAADSGNCSAGLFCTDGVCCGVASCPSGSACVKTTSGAECRKRLGVACTTGDECGSGICADGVCCTASCGGQCEACDIAGKEGTCSPVRGAPHGTRTACSSDDPSSACAARACDGTETASCAGHVGSNVECRASSCKDGVETPRAGCDGEGKCIAAAPKPCGGYQCNATGGACRTECTSASDCAAGYVCRKGACVAQTATCSDDGASLVSTDKTTVACSPYACRDDACLTACTTSADCAAGFACDGAKCVPLPESAADDGGGCAMSTRTSRASGGLMLAMLAIVAAALSRRRWKCPPLALLALFVVACRADPSPPSLGTKSSALWSTTTVTSVRRWSHPATLLADGRVLLVGGGAFIPPSTSIFYSTADVWNPTTGTVSSAGALSREITGHFLARVSTGEVVAIGGGPGWIGGTPTEIYNPTTNAWTSGPAIDPPGLLRSATFAQAIALSDGRAMVAGGMAGTSCVTTGCNPCGCAVDTRIYNPSSRSFTSAPPPSHGPMIDQLVELADGRVLAIGQWVAGNTYLPTCSIFNPSTGTWSSTGSMSFGRINFAAVRLADGRVLVSGGGVNSADTVFPTGSAEIWSPITNSWKLVAPMTKARSSHRMVLLNGGLAFAVSGPDSEVYDPVRDAWVAGPPPAAPRAEFSLTALKDGRVLMAGGYVGGSDPRLRSAASTDEIFSPTPQGSACVLGGECATGACVDGVCCASASCGPGARCNMPGKLGVCAKELGRVCAAATECGSGNCVDGVCCDGACTGQCEACDLAGNLGKCTPVSGSPRNARAACATGIDPCSSKVCDGADRTGCHFAAAGTVACSATACKDGVATRASTCDGTGKCGDTPTSCGSYVCGSVACKTSCSSDADCSVGSFCDGATCVVKRGLGESCTGAGTCTSGLFCVEGVCCAVSSCGAGETCAGMGNAGRCAKVDGAACVVGAECASGACADRVCCNARCDGQCEACDIEGRKGQCSPVTGAPRGARTACGGEGCAARRCDGVERASCAGFVGVEVVCRNASCISGALEQEARCDGMGTCAVNPGATCGGFACDAEGKACRTTCSSDAECAAGHACSGGACQPLSAACSEDGLTAIAADGTRTRCYPLKCAAGVCVDRCSRTDQCAAGFVCDTANGTCQAPSPATSDDGGGCSVVKRTGDNGPLFAIVLSANLLLRRRRRFGRAALAALVLSLAAIVPRVADACSCPAPANRPAPAAGSAIPLNAPALALATRTTAPAATGISLTTAAGAAVAFTTRVDPLFAPARLVEPSAPLAAGGYVLRFPSFEGATTFESASFTVGATSATIPTTLGPLKLTRETGATVPTAAGSCAEKVAGYDLHVAPGLAGLGWDAWLPLTHFETYVDGKEWHPALSICGEEYFSHPVQQFANIDAIIPKRCPSAPETHTVKVRAHVVGATSDPMEISQVVELTCDGVAVPDAGADGALEDTSAPDTAVADTSDLVVADSAPDSAAASPAAAESEGCSCTTPRRGPGSLSAAVLIALVLLRRRPGVRFV